MLKNIPQRFSNRPVTLWILIAFSFVGYLVLSLWFPLRPNFNLSPLRDVRSLSPSLISGLAYMILVTLLFAAYWLAYRRILDRENGLALRWIILVGALFCLPLLFTYPINATDVYRYFIRGRIASVYQANPFSTPPTAIVGDPYALLAGEWKDATSPYGPLWELVAGTVTRISPDDLWISLLLFKGLMALAFLLGGVLIWKSLWRASPAQKASITALWAWNPALLLIFAVNGHNDSLMLLWLLAGWWLFSRGRGQLGMIVMLLAPFTKAIGLLPLPIFFFWAWKQLPGRRSRVRFFAITLLAALALTLLLFLPFGSPVDLAQRLVDEAGGGLGFSPVTLIYSLLDLIEGLAPPLQATTQALAALFVAFAIWLLWKTWKGRSPLRGAADIFVGYILQALSFRIWYASWPFPWLLLDRHQAEEDDPGTNTRLVTGLVFLLTSQLSVIIYGHIRVWLLGGDRLISHLVGVPFTFLLPLLAGILVSRRQRKPKEEEGG